MTLDGTKIKANAGGNTFRRQEKIAAHLQLAREQVRLMEEQAAEEEQMAKRQVGARRRAARQRQSRLEAAVREVERLQREKKDERESFVARASITDPEAHVMRNGEGGTVPSYNVQLLTDAAEGLIVNVDMTTEAVDHHQLAPALERCAETLGRRPEQIVADGDYTNHASVAAAANCGVDFYGSWQESWKPGERDAQGRSAEFLASAFPYDAGAGLLHLPGGRNSDSPCATESRARGPHPRLSPAAGSLPYVCVAQPVRSAESAPPMGPVDFADGRAGRDPGLQGQDGHGRSPADLRVNARASLSFPTPGLKNAAACASSAVAAA